METKVNYVAVGIFVLILGAMLVAAVLWLSVGLGQRNKTKLYLSIVNESVAGLNLDALVKYQGVNVGKVDEISLDKMNPQEVRLLFAINEGTIIKNDTQAVIETQGLTGIAYVELSGGSASAPILGTLAGQAYPQIISKPSLSARLENVLSTALANLDHTTANINALLSDENRQQFGNILKDTSIIMATVAEQKANLRNSIRNAAITSDHTAQASQQLEPMMLQISTSANAITNMADKLALAGGSTQRAVDELGGSARQIRIDTLPELQQMMMELKNLATSLNRLVEQTQRDPSSLVWGRKALPPDPGENQPAAAKP